MVLVDYLGHVDDEYRGVLYFEVENLGYGGGEVKSSFLWIKQVVWYEICDVLGVLDTQEWLV